MTGGWNFDINLKGMPQKVATGFNNLWNEESDFELEFVAYLGTQVVNGTNHAILARHAIAQSPGGEKIVIVVLNEPPGEVDGSGVSLVEMKTILMGYDDDSGITRIDVDIQDGIPDGFDTLYQNALKEYTGGKIEPFQYVGTFRNPDWQLIVSYIAKVTPLTGDTENATSTISVFQVNETTLETKLMPVMEGK